MWDAIKSVVWRIVSILKKFIYIVLYFLKDGHIDPIIKKINDKSEDLKEKASSKIDKSTKKVTDKVKKVDDNITNAIKGKIKK